jgi:hypothetical protein
LTSMMALMLMLIDVAASRPSRGRQIRPCVRLRAARAVTAEPTSLLCRHVLPLLCRPATAARAQLQLPLTAWGGVNAAANIRPRRQRRRFVRLRRVIARTLVGQGLVERPVSASSQILSSYSTSRFSGPQVETEARRRAASRRAAARRPGESAPVLVGFGGRRSAASPAHHRARCGPEDVRAGGMELPWRSGRHPLLRPRLGATRPSRRPRLRRGPLLWASNAHRCGRGSRRRGRRCLGFLGPVGGVVQGPLVPSQRLGESPLDRRWGRVARRQQSTPLR